MLTTAGAPQALASWECEGRTCGTSLWFCCCSTPEGPQDPNCGTGAATTGAAGMACPAACNCVLTVESVESARAAMAVSAHQVFHAPAALSQAPFLVEPLPTEVVARSFESRGPPASKTCLSTPALRGPPALTFTPIGS